VRRWRAKLREREETPFLEHRDKCIFIVFHISFGIVEVVTHLRSLAGRGAFSGPSLKVLCRVA
jgi:hypothetical protein